jgi:hypothetical protein
MENKKMPKYETPQITTYTDDDIREDMGLLHAQYPVITSTI